jgi:hypothetical protein
MGMNNITLAVKVKTGDMFFFVSKNGFMYLDQGDNLIEIGPESAATLDAFIKELENIKRYVEGE